MSSWLGEKKYKLGQNEVQIERTAQPSDKWALCGQRQRKGLLRVFFWFVFVFWGGRGRVVGVSIFLVNSPGEGSAGNRKVRGGRWRSWRQGRRRDGDLLKETAQDPAIWAFKKRA